jgi:hypothetical protein
MKSYEQAALQILLGKEVQAEQVKPEVEKSFPASGVTKHDAPKGVSTMPKDKEKAKGMPAGSMSKMKEESEIGEAMSHPMAVHVKSVPGKKVGGLPAYQVHKIGSSVKGIKVGEHLNDTHLDDLTDMGHKIKMKEDVDYTVISHKSFKMTLPESFSYIDYLNAAKMLDENEAVKIADQFFSEQDDSLVIGSYAISNIQEEIQSFVSEGHEVSLPKYTGEIDNPGVEFTVIDKDSGIATKFIHYGTVERS